MFIQSNFYDAFRLLKRVTVLKAVVYILLIVISTKALAEERESTCINRNDRHNYILPKSIKPIQYAINLTIHIPKHFNFEGNVDILLRIEEGTKCIVLHVVHLKILQVTIKIGNKTINVNHSKDEEMELLILSTQESLLKDKKYILSISYIGSLTTGEDKLGFYRHEYLEQIGPQETKSRWSAITHFQPTYARKAFPCFDEPEYKAKFSISIVTPSEYQALSNMPPDGEPKEVKNGYKYYKFQETAVMSTYVIAFMVIDLSYKSLKYRGRKRYKYSTWTRSNITKYAWYSEDIGPKMLDYLEHYLGIKCEFSKMDQIAIPHFQSKSLEHWGLMIFNEYYLVLDDHQNEYKDSDQSQYDSDELRIGIVVGHEIAHQWFGNLVTLKWWNNTWLNEAFATYFELMTLSVVHELYIKERFLLDYQLYAMVFDSDVSARSLDAGVITPSEIDSKFDVISHQKGASILKMFRDVVTEKTFQVAISKYLQKWKYKNTVPEDLYHALEEQWKKDKHTKAKIYNFFKSWVTNPGYPILHVRRVKTNLFELKQERFIFGQNQVLQNVFWIPLTWTTESEAPDGFEKTQPFSWLTPHSKTKQITIHAKESEWVIFNNQASGYYRVMYDEKLWLLIRELVESRPEILHILNRMQIIDDAHALAKLGKLPYYLALDIGNLLEKELNIYPWKAGMISYGYIDRRFSVGRGYTDFKYYMRNLISNLYNKFGFEEKETDSQNTRRKRAWVLKWACYFEYKDCVRKAKDLYKSYHATNILIPSYMRSVVFCTAIRNGDKDDWVLMWKKIKELKKSKPYNEQYDMLSALGCTKNLEILDKFLRKTITSNNIMQKEIPNTVIASMANYQEGIYLVSKWLARSLKNMSQKFGKTETADYIVAVSSFVNTKEDYYRLETLVNMSIKEFRRVPIFVYKQALESAKINLNWNNYFKDDVMLWLEMKNKEYLALEMKRSRAYLGIPKQKMSTVNYVIVYMIIMNYWYLTNHYI